MTKILKAIALCFLLGSTAQAQNLFKPNSSGGGFNFSVGYQAFSPDDWYKDYYSKDKKDTFNIGGAARPTDFANGERRASVSLFPKPSPGLYTVGFQGYGAFSSIIIGGELNMKIGATQGGTQTDTDYDTAGQEIKPDIVSNTTTRFIAANVLLDIGYVVFRKRGLVIYPMVGIGYSATTIRFRSESTTRLYPDIAEVITKNDKNLQNIYVWTTGVGLDFGVGAQYFLGASNEDKAKGFTLGLKAGYSLQPATNDIRVNDKKAIDGNDKVSLPSWGSQGFYIKLLIGFGRFGE